MYFILPPHDLSFLSVGEGVASCLWPTSVGFDAEEIAHRILKSSRGFRIHEESEDGRRFASSSHDFLILSSICLCVLRKFWRRLVNAHILWEMDRKVERIKLGEG